MILEEIYKFFEKLDRGALFISKPVRKQDGAGRKEITPKWCVFPVTNTLLVQYKICLVLSLMWSAILL